MSHSNILISNIKHLNRSNIIEKIFGNMPDEIIIYILNFLTYKDIIYLELILPNINYYTSLILVESRYEDINILVDITKYNNLSLFKRVFKEFDIFFSYAVGNLKELDNIVSSICNIICSLNNADFFDYLLENIYNDMYEGNITYYNIILYCILRNNKYNWLNKILDKIDIPNSILNFDWSRLIKYIYDKNDNVEILKEYIKYYEIRNTYSDMVFYTINILEDLDKFSNISCQERPKCRKFLIYYIYESSLCGLK
jgi:hypothetical protein